MQCSGIDGGCATVGAIARQSQDSAAVLGEGTRAADNAGEGLIVGRADNETSVIGDVGRVAASIEATCGCDLKGSIVDGGRAVVGVVPGKRERAGAVFGQRARAAHDAGEDLVAIRPKQEVSFVGDISRVIATSKQASGCDLKGSGVYGGGSRIGVIPGKRERACAVFGQRARATNDASEGLAAI